MNVRGNILIIWQGWKPNLQTSTFWHTISLSLPTLPPLNPPVSSSHLTPFVSQGPIKSPPPSLTGALLSLSHSSSLSLKCHLHFSVHILRLVLPVDGLILLALVATSGAHCALCGLQQGDDEACVYACVRQCLCLNMHHKTLSGLAMIPLFTWESLNCSSIFWIVSKLTLWPRSLFAPHWIKVFFTTVSCCNGLAVRKKAALQMFCVSMYTHRPAVLARLSPLSARPGGSDHSLVLTLFLFEQNKTKKHVAIMSSIGHCHSFLPVFQEIKKL